MKIVKDAGKPVILDTSGKLLEEGIKAAPTLIKPNIDEIRMLTGKHCDDINDIIEAAKAIHAGGVEIVVERVSIRCGGGTTRIGRKSWARITPYYGQSKRYDGRGIRSGNRVREEFLSALLECDKKDVPSVTDASVIIVMDRQRANRCMDGLVLQTGNLKIRIQDLVTASYFTGGNEYPYGGNAGKNEAMIKFASKISVGLDMTWESDG